MSFTAQDLVAVDAAIASGELTVRGADGKQITMRSVDELEKSRALIIADLASQSSASAARRQYGPRHLLADFSDC